VRARAHLGAGAAVFLVSMALTLAQAADYPKPTEADFVAADFRFASGETLPQLRIHYRTLGTPRRDAHGVVRNAVLILHGTGGTGGSLLRQEFAGELFASGQPLDASRYFIVLPDGIGHGGSAKPSDGLHAHFPRYGYRDMVQAEYLLLTQGLKVNHARLVMGTSMGGMHTWLWGVRYPQFMDAVVPMASQPTEMAARNWLLRRTMLETIRNDPDYKGGNYESQPRIMKYAIAAYRFASAGGTLGYQTLAPTAAKADRIVDEQLAMPVPADANDFIYQWEASHDYNPSGELEKIEATVLAINAADDERNPPETGVTAAALKRIKNASLYLIPASTETRGHLTTGNAKFYAEPLRQLLQTAPQRTM
jgi:homoserine O-acetyltransferase/O-succinyltransferase